MFFVYLTYKDYKLNFYFYVNLSIWRKVSIKLFVCKGNKTYYCLYIDMKHVDQNKCLVGL